MIASKYFTNMIFKKY